MGEASDTFRDGEKGKMFPKLQLQAWESGRDIASQARAERKKESMR